MIGFDCFFFFSFYSLQFLVNRLYYIYTQSNLYATEIAHSEENATKSMHPRVRNQDSFGVRVQLEICRSRDARNLGYARILCYAQSSLCAILVAQSWLRYRYNVDCV